MRDNERRVLSTGLGPAPSLTSDHPPFRYATKCKFHHPPDVTPTWGTVAPATDVTIGLNKEVSGGKRGRLRRPGLGGRFWGNGRGWGQKQEWRRGSAKVGLPLGHRFSRKGRKARDSNGMPSGDPLTHASLRAHRFHQSYPRRPGEQQCTFFLKTGTCKYKMSCK